MGGPRDERPVGAEATISDEEMEVRMPVGARAMRLETRDDADRKVALARERADRGGDRSYGHAVRNMSGA